MHAYIDSSNARYDLFGGKLSHAFDTLFDTVDYETWSDMTSIIVLCIYPVC